MWPDRVSNPRPLTYESGALLTVLRHLALSPDNTSLMSLKLFYVIFCHKNAIDGRMKSYSG